LKVRARLMEKFREHLHPIAGRIPLPLLQMICSHLLRLQTYTGGPRMIFYSLDDP